MQRMLDDVEMEMTEHQQMKQYQQYQSYQKTFQPFTEEQQKHIDEFTEAFNHYSRVLQYILTKVTKGEVY
eukprot:2212986-Amphidinium_carterae.1